jgi:hypothetical protein
MALPEVRDRQEGFAGGLNTTADDAALKPNEFRVATNTRLSTRGAAEKRGGTQFATTNVVAAFPIRGGYSWGRTVSTQEMIVCNSKLFTGTLALPMSLTDRGGSFSSTVYPTFAAFKGPSTEGVYIADGGLLNFWDGTTLTSDIVNTPAVEAIASWGPRLFGVSGDTLYWSDTTGGINGHTLGAVAGGGTSVVRTYGGQELIMPYPLKSSLLLFHRSAISRFTGATQDDIDIDAGTQGISGDIGTVAKRSVIGVENVVYFLSDRGAFAVTEMDVTPISSPLEETLSGLSKSAWLGVSAVHARAFNEVQWMIPGVGVYAYNYRTQGWTGPWDTGYATTTALWETQDSDGRAVVLAGRSDGRVLWCDRTSAWQDNIPAAGGAGTSYEWSVQCKRFFGSDYTTMKSWRTLYLLGDLPDPANVEVDITTAGGTFTVPLPYSVSQSALTLTWGDASTQWGADGTVWGGGATTGIERGRVPLHGVHPWADVTFRYTGDDSARLSIVDVLGFGRGRR